MISKFNVFNDFTNGNLHIGDNKISFKGSISSETTETAMVLKYTTTTPSEDIQVRMNNSYTKLYNVDWGDGSEDTGITTNTKDHTYALAGTYEVKITGTFEAPNFGGMSTTNRNKIVEFSNWGELKYVYLYQCFYQCINMNYTATDNPDLSTATANKTNIMRQMFYNCDAITGTLDLSGWTNLECIGNYGMLSMFESVSNVKEINLSGWTLTNSDNATSLFKNVGRTNASGTIFTLNNITWTDNTSFASCFNGAKINTINLANWTLKSSGSISFSSFMINCLSDNSIALDLSTWTNTAQMGTMTNFMRSDSDTNVWVSLNTTGWDTSGMTGMSFAFFNCQYLTEITGLNAWKGDSVTTLSNTFYNCKRLVFDTHNFHTTLWNQALTNLTDMGSCFRNVSNSTISVAPNVTDWDVSSVGIFSSCFNDAEFTTALDVSSWDFSSATTLGAFMINNKGTTSITLKNIPSSCTSLQQSFSTAELVTIIFDSSNDLSGVTTCLQICYNTTSLTTLTFDASVSFASVTTWSSAFTNVTLDTTSYDAILVRNDATNSNTPVTLTGGNSLYTKPTSAPATARADLVTLGWTISDGGATP